MKNTHGALPWRYFLPIVPWFLRDPAGKCKSTRRVKGQLITEGDKRVWAPMKLEESRASWPCDVQSSLVRRGGGGRRRPREGEGKGGRREEEGRDGEGKGREEKFLLQVNLMILNNKCMNSAF